jgi:hypothetical protein
LQDNGRKSETCMVYDNTDWHPASPAATPKRADLK